MNNSVLMTCVLTLTTLAIGCKPTETAEFSYDDSSASGYFEGEVIASWDNDGRKMTLREDFSYVDPNNRRWSAPAGSVVDGASIPPAFWTFVGGPFEGHYRKASVVHDVGCHEMKATWEDVHRMFYDACVCGGVDEQTAKVLYYAVYHFGPRWEPVVETVVETHEDSQGHLIQERVQRRRMRCNNPEPPTNDEIQKVVDMVADDNPVPAELERTSREELRRRPRHKRNSKGDRRQYSDDFASGRYQDAGNQHGSKALTERRGREQSRQGYPQSDRDSRSQKRRGGQDRRNEASDLPEEEKQWVARQVQSHLVNRMSQPDPDTYDIERTQEGYRVTARYYERDRHGQPISYSKFELTARVSDAGEVLNVQR